MFLQNILMYTNIKVIQVRYMIHDGVSGIYIVIIIFFTIAGIIYHFFKFEDFVRLVVHLFYPSQEQWWLPFPEVIVSSLSLKYCGRSCCSSAL